MNNNKESFLYFFSSWCCRFKLFVS